MTRPVVLVHGLATSAQRTWVETGLVDLLRDAGREVVLIELPGHGGRPPLPDPAGYADLEALVEEELPDGALDGVGFSAGARLLLRIEARSPARFDRLVLAGIGESVIRSDDHAAFADTVQAVADGTPIDDPVARHFAALAGASGTDLGAVVAMLRRSGTALDAEALGRVAASVVVVLGDRDHAGPGEPLVAALPNARLVTLRGVDHFATPKSMGFIDATLGHLDAS